MEIRFDVKTHPQFTPEELASQLVDSLQSSSDAINDISTYNDQILTERKKIMGLEVLINEVEFFRANQPEKVSRMEPMLQYNLEDLKDEIVQAKLLIDEWNSFISIATEKNKICQATTIRAQKELVNQRMRK